MMLHFDIKINKNQDNPNYCSPTFVVTEDDTRDSFSIPFLENLKTEETIHNIDVLKNGLNKHCKTVEEVKALWT